VDYARNLTRDQLDALKGIPRSRPVRPQGQPIYFALNRKPEARKPEVREALKYLIDYDAIEKNILSGTYIVHQASCRSDSSARSTTSRLLRLAKGEGAARKPARERLLGDARRARVVAAYRHRAGDPGQLAQAGIKLEINPADQSR